MRETVGTILLALAAVAASRRVGGEFRADLLALLVLTASLVVVIAISIRRNYANVRQPKTGTAAVRPNLTDSFGSIGSDRKPAEDPAPSQVAEDPIPANHREGIAEVSFAAGQKLAVVHIPILPLLADTPEVECEPLTDCGIRWKVVVAQPFGVRIDVSRTDDVQDPETVQFAWFAAAGAPSTKAA